MLYLTQDWEEPNVMKAAAVVNIEEAISGVIAVIISVLAVVWIGRFKMVLFTTASFILGLVLLWISTWVLHLRAKISIFYVALLLISFGKAGKDPPFKNYLRDQLSGKDFEQTDDRATFLWRVFKFIGAAVSVFFLTQETWRKTFLICASAMGATYFMFLAGACCSYNQRPTYENPLSVLYKVVKSAFTKRSLPYPTTPSGYSLNQRNELQLFPRDPIFRFIDKAAIIGSTNENVCSVAEVRQAKSLMRLLPLWFAFILYGIVTAAGATFFIEQSNGLNEYIGNKYKVSVNSFFIMKSFASSVAAYLANLVLSRYCNRNETRKLEGGLIRVGAGIAVSIVCCKVASLVEHARLQAINVHGDPDIFSDVVLPMSILWLAPEFILLGLMEGLSEDGLRELFLILVDESMEGFETPINQLMLGIGKVLSVGCVFIFRGWFGHTINISRLDKYLNMLMYLSVGNLVFYLLIGLYYVYVQKKDAQFESGHSQQQELAEYQEEEGGGGGVLDFL
ncbi:Major facilitator superfamily protein [Euphorbia peplus]|nr:Major facilitator superfamily protein [Euphorbia peplus]